LPLTAIKNGTDECRSRHHSIQWRRDAGANELNEIIHDKAAFAELQAGLILGKGGRPKKASTIVTETVVTGM